MAVKKTTTAKKATAKKAAKPAAAAKPKRDKLDKSDLVTFAVRLPRADAAAFHKAAGPAGGSRFARTIMAAFANEDEAAFRAALKEAKELRA